MPSIGGLGGQWVRLWPSTWTKTAPIAKPGNAYFLQLGRRWVRPKQHPRTSCNSLKTINFLPGFTSLLTTGIDSGAAFVGASGNDTFNAGAGALGAPTFTALDSLDGGAGTGDTLNILQTAAVATIPSVVVKNVEIANVSSAASVDLDTTAWTGLTALNVTSSATAAERVNATVTTAVTVANSTAFRVDVVGGGTTSSETNGADKIVDGNNGTVGATADAVAAAAIDANSFTSIATKGGTTVDVTDNSGTTGAIGTKLTTVTLDGNTGAATLTGKGLVNVTVANGVAASDVTITNTTASHTQNLTLNKNATGLVITDAAATTVNVATTGTASAVALAIAAATTLNLSGTVALTLDDTGVNYTALTAVNNTSTAAVTIATTLGNAVTYTGGAAADNISLGATTKAITTGAGDDTVTLVAVSALGTGGSINAGDGTDTLKFSTYGNAVTASATAPFALTISGFEKLELSGVNSAPAAVVNLANLDGISFVTLSATNTETTTISNMASGGTVVFTADQTTAKAATVAVTNASTGTADVLNVSLSKATALANVNLVAADVETINLTSTETATTLLGTVTHGLETLIAVNATTLNISGNAGVTIGAMTGDVALTTINASGVTTGLVSFTTAALTTAATITGGAGANTIVATAATKAVTYVGGAKVDSITINNAQANVIDTGAGDDIIVVGTGANKITAGEGNDTITVGAAAGLNTINVGTGTDTVILGGIQTAAGFYTSVTGMSAGDVLNFDAVAVGATTAGALGAKITLGGVSSFANYLDAAAASATGGGNALIKWFQFTDGNTYVVVDNSNTTTFADGTDSVIQLVGLVDLSTSTTTTAHVVTLV